MRENDVMRFRHLLKGVDVVDILAFGSAISPEYLINLLAQASWNGRYSERYGFIGSSLPGNGWHAGFNTLLCGHHVDWVIGGFFGTVDHINAPLKQNQIEVHNIPQGIASLLLSTEERTVTSHIGIGTFIDPVHKGTLANRDHCPKLTVSRRVENKIEYTIPNSDLLLMRGSGRTKNGMIVLENDPIDLDLDVCLKAAKARGAKIAIQIPDRIVQQPQLVCDASLFDEVFIAPSALHKVTFLPHRYHLNPDNLSRRCEVASRLAEQLSERITLDEKVIVGIGLPVPAVNIIRNTPNRRPFSTYIESGMLGDILYDGEGFGYCYNGKKHLSQNQIFAKIWSGDIDHAILGAGDIDQNRNIHVAELGDKFFGVGGFIDISQSIDKLTFCHREKPISESLPEVSYANNPKQDVMFLCG
ncbi:propionate CoA-transferase [Vibrio ostreicida]|uniref:propionate CoA-transferase n=1 Tax=Vibrio ostreicida TaxID=526588 RepID=UPI0009704BC6|nr:propionate CoA-transferase [Vibrio ostreicida]